MADKPFRVLLDLTDLNIENFKYVWINVAPRELKTISDLKRSVLQKLNLERGDIKLFVRDGLLLEEETIIVLREEDTVKVQYGAECILSDTAESSGKGTAKSSRKRKYSTSNISDLPLNSKRHQIEEHGISNDAAEVDIEKTKSKKKKKKSHSFTEDNKNSCNTENNGSLAVENGHNEEKTRKKKKKRKSSILGHSAASVSFDNTQDPFFSFPSADIQHSEMSHPAVLLKPPPSCTSEANKAIDSANDLLSENSNLNLLNKVHNFVNSYQNKQTEGSTNNCPKKKRKRRRKRKQSTVVDVFESDNTNCNITLLSKDDDDDDEIMHSMHSSSPNKITESRLKNESNLSHNISTNTYVKEDKCFETDVQSSNSYPKISTPAQSNNCGNPSWQVSLMHTSSSVDNNEASNKKELIAHKKPVVKNSFVEISNQTDCKLQKKSMNFFSNLSLSNEDNSLLKSVSSSSVSEPAVVVKPVLKDKENSQSSESNKRVHEKNYSDLPDLNSLPKIGTHIAYRVLELDENYSPTITDYREGIVKSIDLNTETLKIKLTKEVIKAGRTGKFENLRDDEVPPPEIITTNDVKWSSMISPKCLS